MTILAANPTNLQAVANTARPGDIVELATGIYENTWPGSFVLEIRTSGASGYPITFRPAAGAVPIIAAKNNWSAILVEAANYIRIDRIPIVGIARSITYEDAFAASKGPTSPLYSTNGISIYSSRNVSVTNCVITDMPGGGIYAKHSDRLTIERNIVTGCCYWSRYGQSGISVHLPRAVDARNTTTKIKVRWNQCHGNENRIPWERTGKIQDGHGIIFDECEEYPAPMLAEGNACFENGGLGIQRLTAPTVRLRDNLERGNDRSNVT